MPPRLTRILLFVVGATASAVVVDRWLDSESGGMSADRTAAGPLQNTPASGATDRFSGAIVPQNLAAVGAGSAMERGLVIDALAVDADEDPAAALSTALAIEDRALRLTALRLIAAVWARRDPEAGLAQVPLLAEAVQFDFQSTVTREWAFIDPIGFLAYAESADSLAPLFAGLRLLIATDPVRIWEIAGQGPTWSSNAVGRLYMDAAIEMVRRDPATALAQIEPQLTGLRRESLLYEVALAYSEVDAQAALTWVTSLRPPSPLALQRVVGSLIETADSGDVLHAFDLALEAYAAAGISLDDNRSASLADAAYRTDRDLGRIVDVLVQRGDAEAAAPLLERLVGYWARNDLEAAVDWLAAHPTSLELDRNRVNAIFYAAAYADPARAAALTDQLPSGVRINWVSTVAMAYGEVDPEGALRWVEDLRGRPEFDAAREQAVSSITFTDLPLAIGYVADAGAAIDAGSVRALASGWMREDPLAAADWAVGLSDPTMQSAAFQGVVASWLRTEPLDLQRWVLQQPRGETRDRILQSMLASNAIDEALDAERLLEAFESSLLQRQAEAAIAAAE